MTNIKENIHYFSQVEVLVSTMHQEDFSLVDKMNITTSAVIVNQCNRESKEVIYVNGNRILWINTVERGLSKSRNMAIKNATSPICYLADDDLCLHDNFSVIIEKAYSEHPNTDIMFFKVKNIKRQYKNKSTRISYLASMKRSSVEITFKLKNIVDRNIEFNEHFGAGSHFVMGEENLFLFDCLKKNFILRYYPEFISVLDKSSISTWFKGYNNEYFISKGAQFSAMSKLLSPILIFQFALRKYFRYKKECGLIEAIVLMHKGKEALYSLYGDR
jgi:hypothetical protein